MESSTFHRIGLSCLLEVDRLCREMQVPAALLTTTSPAHETVPAQEVPNTYFSNGCQTQSIQRQVSLSPCPQGTQSGVLQTGEENISVELRKPCRAEKASRWTMRDGQGSGWADKGQEVQGAGSGKDSGEFSAAWWKQARERRWDWTRTARLVSGGELMEG